MFQVNRKCIRLPWASTILNKPIAAATCYDDTLFSIVLACHQSLTFQLIQRGLRMNSPIVYLVLSIVLCLPLRSAITTSDQGQTNNIQMLERVDDQQCPSTEEIRNQTNRITTQR